MVKRTITISTIILIISIIAGLIIVLNKTSFAAGEIATGTFGECSWVIDSNGTLTISPTNGTSGMMGNSTENSADSIPWFSYRSRIKELKFTGTVYANDYCNYLFSRCSNLRYADCTNLNTDNSTHMEQLFSYSGITKFTFGNNFKFIVSQTGIISAGMWLKEGTGQEYTASEIMRGVVGSLAGTYTKTKNIAEGLEVTEVITYKVNINSPVTWSSINTDIFKNGQLLYYPLPEEEVGSDYQIEGPIIITYKNAAEKADGSKYDLKITIDNMHLYDYHRNPNTDKYIALFRLSNCEIENIICEEDFSSRVGVNVNYDLKIQIVDSNGNAQQGTFVFSAFDIDVSDLTGEFNSPFSEGINFLQGIDVNAIQTARDTVLVREGNRIRGSCLDGATEASMVLAIANASNTTIKWTAGKPCGTAFLKSYNPTSVQMQKVTNKGVTLTGAGLKLYRGTELIDSWTSTTTPKSFWLNTGTYTLKETSVPNGYYKASDYTIFVEADGSLIVNGNAATSVEMVDQAKSFNVTYSYTGNPPATASTLPAQTAYEYKDLVTVAPNATAPGYTFSGWSRTGSFVMPAENVSITGSFTVKTNTPYKIEHYTEDLNANTFSLRETENKTGTTDTTATATAKTYTGFTYDGTVSGTLTSGNIAGDGSLVLKLYYKRNSYNVSYSYTSAPVSASLLPADQTYEYGAKVTVANNATAPGYTFSGWSRTGTFNMPAQNVEITGGFTANTNTPYKVEHYQKDINSNTYSLKDTENKTGVTDNTATATPKTYEGFTFNSGASTTSGDISGDGNLVLQLYYDRNSHTVSYAYQGTIPNGASALPTSSTYEYGATVTVAQNALAPGYTFSGWNKPATFTMPNENVIIKGSFLSDSNTAYTVEHYWEDLNKNTYTLHETENLTGETDTDVTATPNSYAGFTYNSGLSTPTGTIAGVGNLVLKLYYNRNSYTVSYAYLGTVPTGASSLPSNTTHEFGDTVLVAADAEAPGYTFNGWNRTGTFNMPAQDVEIIGGFTANTDTPYKVEHYQKDLNSNTYTLKETYNKTGVTDNIVTETPKNYEGFTFDSGASTIRGRVSSDGNLVLKLYYTRNSYEVSYAYTSAPVSANLLPADHTYEYDLIFLDAAKGQYPDFLVPIRKLLSKGGILITDNVLLEGSIAESKFTIERRDRTIHKRMREYLFELTHSEDFETVILPVGDGAAVSYKKG